MEDYFEADSIRTKHVDYRLPKVQAVRLERNSYPLIRCHDDSHGCRSDNGVLYPSVDWNYLTLKRWANLKICGPKIMPANLPLTTPTTRVSGRVPL